MKQDKNQIENKYLLKIESINQLNDFVAMNSTMPFEIDVISGRIMIDAKSIMGLYSIDLSKPIMIVVHTDRTDRLRKYKDELTEIFGAYLALKD